jgi:tRNA dimethylallyltransferase
MQVYRGMDIGTAKASLEERALVPHHLIDLINPNESFSVAEYQSLADKAIADINRRGKYPILTGGTGLYYQSVVDSYNFFPVESQRCVRSELEEICEQSGLEVLFRDLMQIDPWYAEKIGPKDKKRIIRGLEVFKLTGTPFSEIQAKKPDQYELLVIGLSLKREDLYIRIDQRVDKMIAAGLVDEVIYLRSQGYDLSMNSMNALGYKQVGYYLDGLISYQSMLEEIKKETRHYAKRQFTWFNRDKRIHWLDLHEFASPEQLHKKIHQLVEGQYLKV